MNEHDMNERETAVYEWLFHERARIAALILDYESGRRKVGRVEDGRLIDETEQEISNLKQRTAQIGILMADF